MLFGAMLPLNELHKNSAVVFVAIAYGPHLPQSFNSNISEEGSDGKDDSERKIPRSQRFDLPVQERQKVVIVCSEETGCCAKMNK
ncbi:hypothetical protein NECAME_14624 [Necator americanus]|uniref:Uncharacterized protein n=1 Tax=Necator americanus TaxID=51031 RepID=W2SLZ7_NECAM|nr:hypothetical protein NECAME_14624 [Necator americanus]ETN70650.1 hypothetical protein NECAME_14624 [Necator americanus]